MQDRSSQYAIDLCLLLESCKLRRVENSNLQLFGGAGEVLVITGVVGSRWMRQGEVVEVFKC